MRVIDCSYIQLPRHFDGSFSDLDRLSLDYQSVILTSVKDLTGNKFAINVKSLDGPEIKTGYIRFQSNTPEFLISKIYKIFKNSIGQKIVDIYNLSFSDKTK